MDLISYLEGLPPSVVGALYSSPWTCRAVLRGIPPLAKQYVMRLVLLDQSVAEGEEPPCREVHRSGIPGAEGLLLPILPHCLLL